MDNIDSLITQLEASCLCDLVNETIPEDTTDEQYKRFYLTLLTNPDKLREIYPVYWAKRSFDKEIKYVLSYLRRNDPNGDWDAFDILVTPLQTIEVLENWKAEFTDGYQDAPGWIDACIDQMYLFLHI